MFGLLWVFVIWSFKCIYCPYQWLACLKPNKLVCKSKSSFFMDYVGKIMAWCLMCLVCSPFINWMKLRNLYLVYINECGGIDVYYHMSPSTSFICFSCYGYVFPSWSNYMDSFRVMYLFSSYEWCLACMDIYIFAFFFIF